MKKALGGAVLLTAFIVTPALADFWVVQDTSTKRCQIVEQRPTGTTVTVIGGNGMVYKTRAEAESAMKAEGLCGSSTATSTEFQPAQVITAVPANSSSLANNWYKQNVYDPSDKKIGEIMDALVDKDGKIVALVIGVGGFLGAGEKDVAVPLNAVHVTTKNNNKWYLVMNTTKDALKNAPGWKYDRTNKMWTQAGK